MISIDLTRMECKGNCGNRGFYLQLCIDLTRMECKVIVYPSGYEQLESIDLTRLECKDQRDPVTAAS